MTTVSKIKKGRPLREETETNKSENMGEVETPNVKKLAEFYPLMNKRMLEWVSSAQKRNVRISSAMLQERAKIVADSIGWTSFRASSGWCVKFLRRNNIRLRHLKRKAQLKSTCQEGTKWEDKILNPKVNAEGMEVVGSDTSDSEAEADDDSLDSDSDNEPGRAKVPTLEGARKAWSQLQEWFITHPPHQDRVMQAVFIINKEMMNPSFQGLPVSTDMSSIGGAGVASSSTASAVSAALPIPIGTVTAGAVGTVGVSSGGSVAGSSSTADGTGAAAGGAGGAAKMGKKKQQMSAALPVSGTGATAAGATSNGTVAVGSDGPSQSFYQAIPAALR